MNSTASRFIRARAIPDGMAFIIIIMLLTAMTFALPVYAKKGGNGGGGGGKPGPFSKFSGTVTNSLTGAGVAGATVELTATGTTITLTTDANGEFSDNKVQVGAYTMDVSATNYNDSSQAISLLKGSTTVDVALDPVANVIINASVSNSAVPGAVLNASGSYIIMDGSSYISSGWSWGGEGVEPLIDDGSDTSAVTLGNTTEYAARLIEVLKEAPIDEGDLPPDVVLQPINEIEKGLQDRNQVVAINPFALEKAEAVPLIYTVVTDSGSYSEEVDVLTHLPWIVNTGVRTVPVNSTVLLYAKENGGYNWAITGFPNGSAAALTNGDTQTPWFTPDVVGTYQLTESNSGAIIDVHAGRYHGVIDPVLTLGSVQFGDGRPVADPSCTSCHYEGGAAPANFDTWRNTGHAEAFTQGITTNSHFGERCFACHAVGFGKENGIDDTPNYDAFMTDLSDAQHASPPSIAGLWESMLQDQPDTARLSNIQCENCHGPQNYTNAHMDQPGAPRVSLSADVCGSCHGEPERHGRFQQWLLSNHADYDLARERGAGGFAPGNCGRCHSGNGFIAWSKLDFDPHQEVDVTWDEDTVVPQVCAACHNPHDTGTTSGSDGTDAKVRVMGDTHELIAAFTATNVGKGATCMTCHNSRAELPRNDASWDSLPDDEKVDGHPHHGVQADLIMGQNAYFLSPTELVRGKHSLIEDVCVTCHMNKTQPPDILSYNQQGTNHTFAADPNICSECHGPSDPSAENIDAIVNGYLDDLQAALGDAYMRLLNQNYPIDVDGGCATNGADQVTSVVWNYGGFRGATVDVTVGGATCNSGLSDVTVNGGAQTLEQLALESANDAVLKARWNYGLLYEDSAVGAGARGVHNPDFSIKALTGAIAAVQAVAP